MNNDIKDANTQNFVAASHGIELELLDASRRIFSLGFKLIHDSHLVITIVTLHGYIWSHASHLQSRHYMTICIQGSGYV